MRLYVVILDGCRSYVEAETMEAAIKLWREFTGHEHLEPSVCRMVHMWPVVRREN